MFGHIDATLGAVDMLREWRALFPGTRYLAVGVHYKRKQARSNPSNRGPWRNNRAASFPCRTLPVGGLVRIR